MNALSGMDNNLWKTTLQQNNGWSRTAVPGAGSSSSDQFQNILNDSGVSGTSAVKQGPDLDHRTASLINRLDQDGDGSLSADEMKISPDAFSKIDTNGDGKLNMQELNAAYLSQHAAQQYGIALNS